MPGLGKLSTRVRNNNFEINKTKQNKTKKKKKKKILWRALAKKYTLHISVLT